MPLIHPSLVPSRLAPSESESETCGGDLPGKEWRPVPVSGVERRYEVSSLGRVRGVPRIDARGYWLRSRLLSPQSNPQTGYSMLTLYDGTGLAGAHFVYVHRLVAQAFVANPASKPEVNHIDLDRSNNAVSNLEWVTTAENGAHRRASGPVAYARGEDSSRHVLLDDDVRLIRKLASDGMGHRTLGRRFGVDHKTIGAVVHRKSWTHL